MGRVTKLFETIEGPHDVRVVGQAYVRYDDLSRWQAYTTHLTKHRVRIAQVVKGVSGKHERKRIIGKGKSGNVVYMPLNVFDLDWPEALAPSQSSLESNRSR